MIPNTTSMFTPAPSSPTAAALASSSKLRFIFSFSIGSVTSFLAIFSISSCISLSLVGSS
jgi:hypothetical protein